MKLRISGLCAFALIGLIAGIVFAGKGGGKPGGGGGDPVYTVSYQSGTMGSTPYVMTEDGSTTTKLGRKLVWSTTWHADGDRLLVAADSYRGGPGVYELSLSGKETKVFGVLDSSASQASPNMSRVASPSGDRLITYLDRANAADNLSLWVRNEDGTNPVEILAADPDVYLSYPVFHPSGESIALKRKTAGVPGKIWLLELDFDSDGDAFVSSMSALTGLTGTALEGVDTNSPTFTNSGETLAVNGDWSIWFVDMSNLTEITEVIARGDLYGSGDNPLCGGWNATDDLFYFTAVNADGRRIHVLDSAGDVTNLGGKVGNQHWPACKMP
jgi:hypothetical protein